MVDPNVQIEHLTPDRIDAAAVVLAEAFAEETLFTYLLGGDQPSRARLLTPFLRGMIRGHLRFGEVHTAILRGKVVGTAIRVPPGRFPMSAGDSVRLAGHTLPTFLAICARRPRFFRMFRVAQVLGEFHKQKENYWYLAFVGVDPRHRRQGVASALARFVLRRADESRAGCYLDTFGEGTKKLYLARGFEVLGELRPFDDGPTGYRMWRSPRPTEQR